MPKKVRKTVSRNQQKVESINRQLMNTVRNIERGAAEGAENKYSSNYDSTNIRWPKTSQGQRFTSETRLNAAVKKQSKDAKKASKRK